MQEQPFSKTWRLQIPLCLKDFSSSKFKLMERQMCFNWQERAGGLVELSNVTEMVHSFYCQAKDKSEVKTGFFFVPELLKLFILPCVARD